MQEGEKRSHWIWFVFTTAEGIWSQLSVVVLWYSRWQWGVCLLGSSSTERMAARDYERYFATFCQGCKRGDGGVEL